MWFRFVLIDQCAWTCVFLYLFMLRRALTNSDFGAAEFHTGCGRLGEGEGGKFASPHCLLGSI